MPYPETLLKKYINYQVYPGSDFNDDLEDQLVHGLLPNQTSNAVVTVFADRPASRNNAPVRGVQQLYGPKDQPWHFTFLKYFGGAVTTTPMAGAVMTGPMSGCYIFQYTQGGNQYLAHVGTADSPNSRATIAVKDRWRQFIARPDVSGVTGMQPDSLFTTGDLSASMFGQKPPVIVAYFSGGIAYSLLLVEVPLQFNPPGMRLMLVEKVSRATMLPWAAIDAQFG